MKKESSLFLLVLCLLVSFFVQGCANQKRVDYSNYLEHMPRSILVLPPQNESTEVMAPYIYLSTVTRPLAERGYYVFPVAVIDALMKENGVPSPYEMAQVPLNKIREIINPDAVLYMTIQEWGTEYRILDSATTVRLWGRIVDTDTGIVIWEGKETVVHSSSSGQSGIVEMLVAALVNQIVSTLTDPSHDVACETNSRLFLNEDDGLLIGERCSGYEEDQREHRALQNQAIEQDGNP